MSSLHLLFAFTVLLLEQVHSKQSAQVPIAWPHGDSGLKEQKRIEGQDAGMSRQRRRKHMYASSLCKLIPFHCSSEHLVSFQHAMYNMQPATLQHANLPRATCAKCKIQHKTTRCGSTPALVLIACFGPINATSLLGNAILSAFPYLCEYSCATEEGMRITEEPVTRM